MDRPKISPEIRFWKHVNKTDTCWFWTGATNRKYGIFPNENERSTHRYSWFLHNGAIPDGQCICHTCDTPTCVRPDHLFLASQQENIFDAIKKGRFANQKLSVKEVEKIRILFEHFSAEELSRIFNVHASTINKIVQKRIRING